MADLLIISNAGSNTSGPWRCLYSLYDTSGDEVVVLRSFEDSTNWSYRQSAVWSNGLWFVALDDGVGGGANTYTIYVTPDFSSLPLKMAYTAPYATYGMYGFWVVWNQAANSYVVMLRLGVTAGEVAVSWTCNASGSSWSALPDLDITVPYSSDYDFRLAGVYGGVVVTSWGHSLVGGAWVGGTMQNPSLRAFFVDATWGVDGSSMLTPIPGFAGTPYLLTSEAPSWSGWPTRFSTSAAGVVVLASWELWLVKMTGPPHLSDLGAGTVSSSADDILANPFSNTIVATGNLFGSDKYAISHDAGTTWGAEGTWPTFQWFASEGPPSFFLGGVASIPPPPAFWTDFVISYETP
jgi:hypothetical protein